VRELGFDQPGNVIRPLHILQLLVVVEVEVVKLPVVQFGVEHLTDQFVDVFHLAVDVLLEHPESLGGVENFECSHSTQELHRFL